MRMTIDLPDALGEAVRAKAAAEGRTFSSVIEEGLKAVLQWEARPTEVEPLPAYGSPDERPLVDLTDHDAVWPAPRR